MIYAVPTRPFLALMLELVQVWMHDRRIDQLFRKTRLSNLESYMSAKVPTWPIQPISNTKLGVNRTKARLIDPEYCLVASASLSPTLERIR